MAGTAETGLSTDAPLRVVLRTNEELGFFVTEAGGRGETKIMKYIGGVFAVYLPHDFSDPT